MFTIGWAAPISSFVSIILCMVYLARMKPEAAVHIEDAPQLEGMATGPKFVITIAREYGSGGRLIGERAAEKLGVAFYNRNLIDLTAQRSGLAESYITNWEERISSHMIWSGASGGRNIDTPWLGGYYNNADIMFQTQSQIIRELAEKEACVIVGRCADYVLREYPRCVNVFIYADENEKVDRLIREYGIGPKDAAKAAAATDKGRAFYYQQYAGGRWGDHEQYHIMINSGLWGIEGSADLIVEGIRRLYRVE